MNRSITVVRTGPLALLQDAGRIGHASDGVGRSGAADRASYALANELVGNPAGATAIECVLGGLVGPGRIGPRRRRHRGAGRRGHRWGIRRARHPDTPAGGSDPAAAHPTLRTPHLSGGRRRLSTRRRFSARPAPTPCPSSVRRRSPRVTSCGSVTRRPVDRCTGPHRRPTVIGEPVTSLRVRLGPRDDWFADPADLAVGEWLVSPHSNRVGVRLDRPVDPGRGEEPAHPALHRTITHEMPSEGLPLGAIQVPPSGQPVIFLADHPLTGGYPVIAVVLDDDIDRAAQVRPGQRLRFVLTT